MYSIGDDFGTPAMYQDMASGPMGMNMMPIAPYGSMYGGIYGAGMRYPSYLKGAELRSQPSDDIYVSEKVRDKKDKNVMKKVGMALLLMVGVGFIGPARKHIASKGGLTKWAKGVYQNFTKDCKKFFKANS